MPILNANILTAPGTYIQESTGGLIPAGIATFNRIYMVGTAAQGPINTPTQVVSTDDFENQFGASPSLDSVRLVFAMYRNAVLFFSRAGAPGIAEVPIGTPSAGAYSVELNDGTAAYTATYTNPASQTPAQVAAGIANAINMHPNLSSSFNAIAGTDKVQIETLLPGASFTVASTSAPGAAAFTPRYWQYQVVADVVNTGVWELEINGVGISYTAAGTPALSDIVDGLQVAVNSSALNVDVLVDQVTPTGFVISARSADTLISVVGNAPAGSTLTPSPLVARPSFAEYIESVQKSFNPDNHAQGILIAPDAFESIADQTQRVAVGTAMENLAASEGFAWMVFVDSGSPTQIQNVTQANAEGQLYATAEGHLAYYYPYVTDLEGRQVPPSAAVAGLFLARAADQGFQQPPAGGQYPVKGVTGLVHEITKAQQAVSNPLGINLLRYIPNQGVLVYGSRTRANSPFYRFVNTRIILNVLIGTLRGSFDELIHTAVDGNGLLFVRIRETADAICYRFYQGRALYGAVPEDAYAIKCDTENNPALDLEDGIVRCDIYVAPVPTMERLLINVVRTAIGQVQVVAQQG